MKNFIYCFILGIWGMASQAQLNKITQGEYFWDTDPGEGNATALTAADGNFDNVLESVMQNTAAVPGTAGLHTFNIRLKDNVGVWGPVFKNVVNTGNSTTTAYATLTQAEYFWDTDPGEGSATAVAAADNTFDAVLENVMQNTASIPATPGLHTFSIRIKDNTGNWGPVFKNIVHTGNSATSNYATLTQAEFFWDTDPGEGSGTPIAAADGSFDGVIEGILQSNVYLVNPLGLHKFNIRVKDNQGVWGPVFTNVIFNENVLSVDPHTIAENYYFIPNPATSVIRFNKDIESIIVIDLNGRQMAASVNNNEVNIEGLATGTYILKVTTPEGLSFNKKMIKR
ncbi:T9SS type A sorting domain-containing protein [Flavobacterium wongokense]|uniref:T9SS type A sorting domain-containing protein n=1 Tax=Flavobacterium wongokense TaxID=2910674 RepID=UPI001F4071CD|nr:T9SS type A sorting domain-containing protein [Flavobacterium sp. WG47]MCF6131702.1 T9SS type A sorting domain-containing protein [Flavobacterium sp. WG47]